MASKATINCIIYTYTEILHWCNAIINRDKAEYYSAVISDNVNSNDTKKLRQALQHVLATDLEIILSLRKIFGKPICFLLQSKKIKKIHDTFPASSSTVILTTCPPPNLPHFNEVSKNKVLKIIKTSFIKSCLLDPVSIFLLKDCVDILLMSITKLVNLSLADGFFLKNSKRQLLFS